MEDREYKDETAEDDLLLQKEEAESKPYTAREARGALSRWVSPFQKEISVIIFFGILSALANGSVPYITGRFFDSLIALSQGEELAFHSMTLWSALLLSWVGLQLLANLIDWRMGIKQESVWLKMRLNAESSGFVHLLKLPLAYHKQHSMSGAIEMINKAGWRVSSAFRNIISITPQFLSMFIGILLAASINKTLAGILLLGVCVYVAILVALLRPIAALDDRAHRVWNKGWEKAAEKINNTETVKQSSSEDRESRNIIYTHMNLIYNTWLRMELHWGNISFWQRIIVFATQLGVFLFAIHLIRDGSISVGELIAVNGYALMFFGPLVQLGHSWQNIQNGITAAVHAEEVMLESEEVYRPKNITSPAPFTGSVTFNNVHFRYEEGEPLVLNGLTFSASPGDVIALVGESGGGKSTTIGLFGGYYFPSEGSVEVSGVNTREFDLRELRGHLAVVPQEVTLFNNSIGYNLSYGTPKASKEDIARVTKEVHLEEFIASLPKKYDALVGERGLKLSVGQKQRVAIARAMLRNPSILILDEPTSALDAQTEHYISASLTKLMEGRTTFIIAHRLSTVRRADKILVFKNGTIAESGTHDELLKKEDGVYRNLHNHQIGLYE